MDTWQTLPVIVFLIVALDGRNNPLHPIFQNIHDIRQPLTRKCNASQRI